MCEAVDHGAQDVLTEHAYAKRGIRTGAGVVRVRQGGLVNSGVRPHQGVYTGFVAMNKGNTKGAVFQTADGAIMPLNRS
jgi:hypothetical protein